MLGTYDARVQALGAPWHQVLFVVRSKGKGGGRRWLRFGSSGVGNVAVVEVKKLRLWDEKKIFGVRKRLYHCCQFTRPVQYPLPFGKGASAVPKQGEIVFQVTRAGFKHYADIPI